MTSLKKIYDLVCDRLGIQTLIRLNCDLIKFSAASGKVVHGRIRHIYGHRHSIVSIADKGSVLFLCGDSADAECLGQIIAGNVQCHSHYIIRSEKPLRIGIGDHADVFSLFDFLLPEIASVLHRSIIHQLGILGLPGHCKIKITLSGYGLACIGLRNINTFHAIQLPDCINILRLDPDLVCYGIITAVNSDLAAADIIDLTVHLILRTLTDGHNGDH